MNISGVTKHFYSDRFRSCNNDKSGSLIGNDSAHEAIPRRYRDGAGGVNLEQVQVDQREARKQVVRTMIQRLASRVLKG